MYGCLTLMLSALLIGAVGTGTQPPDPIYTVSRIEAVDAENVFVCRLRDYAWPTQARFTVRPSVLSVPSEPIDLDRPVNLAQFSAETTFQEALSILSSSVQPPLPILVMSDAWQ